MARSDNRQSYPRQPGYQATDTSRDAARDMIPFTPTLQDLILSALEERGDMATFELATYLNRRYHSIQPRTSELRAENLIFDSGKRIVDPDTKKKVIVWKRSPKQKEGKE